MGADGGVATRVELSDERALGCEAEERVAVSQLGGELGDVGVVGSRLQGETALARRWREPRRVDRGAFARAAEPGKPGGGEDDRVVAPLAESPQPGVDIPAQLADVEIRPGRQQLCLSTQTGGADDGACGQLTQRRRTAQRVPRVGTLWNRHD